MSLRNVIDKFRGSNLDPKMKKLDIYNEYKDLNDVIYFDKKLKKNELIDIVNNVINYDNRRCNIKLNKDQLNIINSPINNHMRIIACAGSGKTTTIIYRIKYLLDNNIAPNQILLLTFNVEACNDLKNKIVEVMGFYPRIEIRTIDSLSAKLYFQYSHELGLKYIKYISLSEFSIFSGRILEKFGHIICRNYKYIFFDEFQDINNIQFDILKYFIKNGCYLTVIGDDNQNIYQWRGTSNMYMINFDKSYPNTNTYTLKINYRSNKSIVKIANKSIQNNKNRIDKEMVPYNNKKLKPKLILYEDQDKAFKSIVSRINKFSKKMTYDKIAILSRNNTYLKLIEEYLTKYKKIPFISLLTNSDSENKVKIEKNKIVLCSIHKSKGLEWDVVFIIGLNNNIFPSMMNNSTNNLEEERRLFYVAITRAKNHLMFIFNQKEIPISNFIYEIFDDIKYRDYSKLSIKKKDLFGDNEDYIKFNYDVQEIVNNLRPSDYVKLRENNLLLELDNKKDFIDNKIKYGKEIVNNSLNNDLNIFFNRIITRSYQMKSNEGIEDYYVDKLINAVYLNDNEAKIFNKVDLNRMIFIEKYNKNDLYGHFSNHKDRKIIYNIISKMPDNLDKIIYMRDNTYPKKFIKNIIKSYQKFINYNNSNDRILKDIYNISLIENIIKHNRRRLIYKDVFNIFENEYLKISRNIDEYLENNKIDNIICNKHTEYQIKVKTRNINVSSSVLIINLDDRKIVDIRYSNGSFKLEWMIELLMNYSLLMKFNNEYDIRKLTIVNMVKGKEYNFVIPSNYNYLDMYKLMVSIIKRDMYKKYNQYPSSDIFNIDNMVNIVNHECRNEKENTEMISINIKDKNNKYHYMVIDTETTGLNIRQDEIIQLAYIIYDKDRNKVKKFNKFIKPKFNLITKDSKNVHKISNEILLNEGNDFCEIVEELLNDMNSCKVIIGHNIDFDINIIKNNVNRYNIKMDDIFDDNKEIICTMKLYGKRISLGKLYWKLFNNRITNAHNALSDVKYCAKCYFKLI